MAYSLTPLGARVATSRRGLIDLVEAGMPEVRVAQQRYGRARERSWRPSGLRVDGDPFGLCHALSVRYRLLCGHWPSLGRGLRLVLDRLAFGR